MKRFVVVGLLLLAGLQAVEPALAARRVAVRRGPRRTVVVVHRGWPLRRPVRTVVVHPVRVAVRVQPALFLPVVVWTGAAVAMATAPSHDVVWVDGETLVREDDWTEFTLNVDRRGSRMWLEVADGRIQFDWAEVVFENGETRVVDMREWTRDPGLYPLLDFKDGRKVDHVRAVARARTPDARVTVKMER